MGDNHTHSLQNINCTFVDQNGDLRHLSIPATDAWKVLTVPYENIPNLGDKQPDGSHIVYYMVSNTHSKQAQYELIRRLEHHFAPEVLDELARKGPVIKDWMEQTSWIQGPALDSKHPYHQEAKAILAEIDRTRELANKPNYQIMVREVLDEVERIGNISFVETDDPDIAHLTIGHAPPLEAYMKDTRNDFNGVTALSNSNRSDITVRERQYEDAKKTTLRHEIGHALKLAHYSNYYKDDPDREHRHCDTGGFDMGENSVMSYDPGRSGFGEDDIAAIQSRYGVTTHPTPYVAQTPVRVNTDIPDHYVRQFSFSKYGNMVALQVSDDGNLIVKQTASDQYQIDNRYNLTTPTSISALKIAGTARDDTIRLDTDAELVVYELKGSDILEINRSDTTIYYDPTSSVSSNANITAQAGSNFAFRTVKDAPSSVQATFDIILKDVELTPEADINFDPISDDFFEIFGKDIAYTKISTAGTEPFTVRDMNGEMIGSFTPARPEVKHVEQEQLDRN